MPHETRSHMFNRIVQRNVTGRKEMRAALRGHGDDLHVPSYVWDGGEEPDIAGVYVISPQGEPFRIGLTIAE